MRVKIRKRLNELLAQHTGQTYEDICEHTERDNFMSADESKAYGLVDEVPCLCHADEVCSCHWANC